MHAGYCGISGPPRDVLVQLCIDGQDLRVAHKCKSQNGDGVSCLQDKHIQYMSLSISVSFFPCYNTALLTVPLGPRQVISLHLASLGNLFLHAVILNS